PVIIHTPRILILDFLYTFSYFFLFQCDLHYPDLHSFPTRRSSDLLTKENPAARRNPIDTEFDRIFLLRNKEADEFYAKVAPSLSDRKSTRLNSSHGSISYAVFCLKKKKTKKLIHKINKQD